MRRLPRRYKFYEFFAGAGMARLGLEHRWDCVWANDNDPRKNAIYKHNFGAQHLDPRDVALVADDVENGLFHSNQDVPDFPLHADLAWASFPCQDLSLAGWQRGMSAERSGAYWPYWKIMHALKKIGNKPSVMVIENVKGLLYGDSFGGLCESLAALGMRFGAFLADSNCFVPQSRPRVFVIAVDEHVELTGLNSEKMPNNTWFPAIVHTAYSNLSEELKDRWVWWQIGPGEDTCLDINSVFEANPTDVDYDTKEQTERFLSLMASRHLKKVEAAKHSSPMQVGFLYKRTRDGQQRAEVRFDGTAGCLRTPKGGSSRQTVVVVRNKKVQTRLLSRVEAARLMGINLDSHGRLPGKEQSFFPEKFSYNDAYFAMGDGVVVPVVKHIATSILDELARRSIAVTKNTNKAINLHSDDSTLNPFLERVGQHIAAWSASAK